MSSRRPGPDGGFDLAQVESMLRAAGDYVGPSDDLRPRVLDEVRRQRSSNRQRHGVLFAGAAVLLAAGTIGLQAASVGGSVAEATPSQRVAKQVNAAAASSQRKQTGVGAFCWSLVDAFISVRESQADALGPERP